MELIAQPWAAGELRGPSSLSEIFLEDIYSLSETDRCVQLKKSIGTMWRKCGTEVIGEELNHAAIKQTIETASFND